MPDTVNPPETLQPIPPLPPNQAVLTVRPGPDRVHTILRLQFDCTHMSEDGQKLMIHMLTKALTEFEKSILAMNKIEVASQLGKLERTKALKKNGQPSNG